MKKWASWLSGIACWGLIALSSAQAGEVASKAAEAETLLSAGKTTEALTSLDAAVDAFWAATPLTFRKALFVDEAKGFGDYTVRANPTFAPGSTLLVYAEPVGYGWSIAENSFKVAFSTELEIHDKKGLILTKAAAPATLQRLLKEKSREFQISIGFTLPQIKPDEYSLVLKMTDAATAKTATIELPFTISG